MMKWISLLSTLPLHVWGFTLFANVTLQFGHHEVPVYVVDEGNNACAHGNFTEDDLVGYVEEATRMWNSVSTSKLVLVPAGKVSGSSTDFTTGELCNWDASYPPSDCTNATKVPQVSGIYVACSTNANDNQNFPQTGTYSTSILAATTMNNLSGTNIVGSVVLMNTADSSVAIKDKSASEIIAIVAHELGHAVGLGHSEQTHSLMYEQSLGVRTALTVDDALGVSYLYPVKLDGCGLFGTIKRIDEENEPRNPTGFSFALILLGFLLVGLTKRSFLYLKNK